jgi:hypothetical protein
MRIVPPGPDDARFYRALSRDLAAENRRLKRDRAQLRSALRAAIAIVERQGGYVVGEDVKALAARGRR